MKIPIVLLRKINGVDYENHQGLIRMPSPAKSAYSHLFLCDYIFSSCFDSYYKWIWFSLIPQYYSANGTTMQLNTYSARVFLL